MKRIALILKYLILDDVLGAPCVWMCSKILSGPLHWFILGALGGYLTLIFGIDIFVQLIQLISEPNPEWFAPQAIPTLGEILGAMAEGATAKTRLTYEEQLKLKEALRVRDEYENSSHNRPKGK